MKTSAPHPIPDEDALWQAALDRDPAADGTFIVAVKSTGIYCRPTCPARRPKRENVIFFTNCDEAEAAGFRACLRCKPQAGLQHADAGLLRQACAHLEENGEEPLKLNDISARLGISTPRLRRIFVRLLGMTPPQYAEGRRLERLKGALKNGRSVTEALYEAGYGSSSRLYEGAGTRLGMTPGRYRKGGSGVTIWYRTAECMLGRLLVAGTERGVCAVHVADTDSQVEAALRREYPKARLELDDGRLGDWLVPVLDYLDGRRQRLDLPLDIQGTAFQLRVWRAIQQIAYGHTRSYGELAKAIGQPGAVRAVGQACGSNPVPLVIPCHRVVASGGRLGGYGLGLDRKRKLLALEEAKEPEASTM